MIVTRKSLSRRTVLRGLGATMALPLLDGMVPAFAAQSKTAARPVIRLGVMYVPMGAVMNNWTPAGEGAQFEMSPILQPLTPFRDRLLVLTGLDNEPAVARLGEPAGGHGRIGGAFLTGVHAKPTEGADFEAGVSVDQIAAAHLGQQTQLASLELGLETTGLAGACDVGYSCAYVNTLCWRSATTPLPMESNPRAVFERLFGDSDSTDRATRLARIQQERSEYDRLMRSVEQLYAQGALAAEGTAQAVYVEGAANLVITEQDQERLRQLLATLEEKQRILDLLSAYLDVRQEAVRVVVGLEEAMPHLSNFVLIGMPARVGDEVMGSLAVIGPTRMDYEHTMTAVSYIARLFDKLWNEST